MLIPPVKWYEARAMVKPYEKCVDAMWCDLTFADLVSKNWHQLISLVGAFLVCQQKLTLRDAS